MGTVKVLKCIPEDRGNEYNDYKYPKWRGKPVSIECKDWAPRKVCGNGFHGITKDINNFNIFCYGPIFQVMDVDDNPDNFVIIDNEKVKFHKGYIIYQGDNAYKALRMVFDSDEEMVNWFQFSLEYIKPEDQTEELQLLAVKKNSRNLEYCHNPTYKVMYEAVKNNGWVIRFIKPEDQTEELQLLAVQRYIHTLKYSYNPSYKVIVKALKTCGFAIGYIGPEEQTEELQLLAVENHPNAIDYCYKPSEKVKQLHKELWER